MAAVSKPVYSAKARRVPQKSTRLQDLASRDVNIPTEKSRCLVKPDDQRCVIRLELLSVSHSTWKMMTLLSCFG